MALFDSVLIIQDRAFRTGALNMAMDEALFEEATQPVIRFYQWDHPALSFGYFVRYAEVATLAAERDLVRRWTGGGIVFHGNDLTYSVIIPASDRSFGQSSNAIYQAVHLALRNALHATGRRAELAETGNPASDRFGACFANPVPADVMLDGKKIAGAAHRRSRRGLLHQGSIQLPHISGDLAESFAAGLAEKCQPERLSEHLEKRAAEIAGLKYGAEKWLQRR